MPDLPSPEHPDTYIQELDEKDIAGLSEQSVVPIMAVDRNLRYVFANAAYCKVLDKSRDELIGSYVFDVYQAPPDDQESFRQKCDRAFRGEVTRSDIHTRLITGKDGRARTIYWQSTQEPFHSPDGEIRYIIQRSENVTHLVELQKSHDVISAELDHRVKNFVSVILATARITAVSATSVSQYTEDFCSRIDSMARIYSRMSSLGLTGLQLRSLFEDELAQISSQKAIQYSLKGDDIQLTGKSTRDGGMVIHEFVTNALRHGCFSRPGGRLDVEWSVSGNLLRVLWVESGLTGIKPPERIGFGTRLTDMLPNAKVKREYRDSGLTIEYVVPIDLVIQEIERNDNWPAQG